MIVFLLTLMVLAAFLGLFILGVLIREYFSKIFDLSFNELDVHPCDKKYGLKVKNRYDIYHTVHGLIKATEIYRVKQYKLER